MALDLSTDYKAVDFPEAITLTSMPGGTPLSVTHAFYGELTRRELAATNGALVRIEAAYDVPMVLAPGPWKPGDRLVNSLGDTLRVYQASRDPTTAFWRLMVFAPALAFGLTDLVDVIQNTEAADTGGLRQTTTATTTSNIVCRIQPLENTMDMVGDRVGTRKRYVIYFAENLAVDFEPHRMTVKLKGTKFGVDGKIADVLRYYDAERIDEPAKMEVELRP